MGDDDDDYGKRIILGAGKRLERSYYDAACGFGGV